MKYKRTLLETGRIFCIFGTLIGLFVLVNHSRGQTPTGNFSESNLNSK